jgi:hypothetical protein
MLVVAAADRVGSHQIDRRAMPVIGERDGRPHSSPSSPYPAEISDLLPPCQGRAAPERSGGQPLCARHGAELGV